MAETFGVVLFVVVGVAAIVAVVTLVGSKRTYDEIGRGDLALRDGSDGAGGTGPGSIGGPAVGPGGRPVDTAAVREEEIRQLVQARSDRRIRRGEPPLDVDAEVAQLAAPVVDPGLRGEIHDMVVARNARLRRAGKPELDVEAETERRMRELEA